jgi:hypothetical protein
MSLPNRISEILEAVVKRTGYFTTFDIERAEGQVPWNSPRPYMNAKPNRMKICPICGMRRRIAEFLVDSTELRTVIVFHEIAQEEFCIPVADVREWCATCNRRGEKNAVLIEAGVQSFV